jgi:hypothetical protein
LRNRTITFGTDGVRGVANKGLLPEDALCLGLAASRAFGGKILATRASQERCSPAPCVPALRAVAPTS